jgi:hypothetical protein
MVVVGDPTAAVAAITDPIRSTEPMTMAAGFRGVKVGNVSSYEGAPCWNGTFGAGRDRVWSRARPTGRPTASGASVAAADALRDRVIVSLLLRVVSGFSGLAVIVGFRCRC